MVTGVGLAVRGRGCVQFMALAPTGGGRMGMWKCFMRRGRGFSKLMSPRLTVDVCITLRAVYARGGLCMGSSLAAAASAGAAHACERAYSVRPMFPSDERHRSVRLASSFAWAEHGLSEGRGAAYRHAGGP